MSVVKSSLPDILLRDLTISQRVFEGLMIDPGKIVLTDGVSGDTLTALQFMDRVKSLAGGLRARGLGGGATVALMAPNMPEYAVIFHAVAYAGGTITTINPTYTSAEIAYQLKDSNASVLLTVPMFEDTAKAATTESGVVEVILIGTAAYEALNGTPLDEQVPVDLDQHTVVLPYSSGTTGLPKGVMLSHRNLVVNVEQCIEFLGMNQEDVTVAFLPFFHIYGMTVEMNVYLGCGGSLVTMPRFDLPLFLQLSQDYKTPRMWIVPPVALALAKHPLVDDYDLSTLEIVYIAAAPSGAELSNSITSRLGCKTLQGYGMTELSPVSHAGSPDMATPGAAGVLLPNTLARIVDIESGADLGRDEEGELWVKGPQVMQGYLNNSQATADTIVADDWLRTGDIARIDADGNLFIVDRLKELIKYKGFQVAPAELEAALVGMDGILDAAVVGRVDIEAGELPVAFIVRSDDAPSDADIMAHMKTVLSHYKQLHEIKTVDEIPKNASGKILRRVLRDSLSEA